MTSDDTPADRGGPAGGPRAARQAKKLVARRVPPIRRLLDERERLSGEVHDLRGEIHRLHGQIGDLHGQIGDLHGQIGDLHGQIGDLRQEAASLRRAAGFYPAGHYYSPIPDFEEVRAREHELFDRPPRLAGIDLRADAQLNLVDKLRQFADDQPFSADPTPGLRYHFQNEVFGLGDGLILFCMLRHLQPARVIEVGSGFSSALMLDTVERFLDGRTALTFIEPFPDRLHSVLREGDHDRVTILAKPVQEVDTAVFERLEAGDILFIDSSHVSKVGGDVNLLLLEVVPRLPAGVHVHVHDIIWPFEYARHWFHWGRAWNEAYLLRALLVDNARLRITFWGSYLRARHEDLMAAALPLWMRDPGTSMWLETA